MTESADAVPSVWAIYGRQFRRIGAAVAVEDCAGRQLQRLPVPAAAVMALALSGVRALDLDRASRSVIGWAAQTRTLQRAGALGEFLAVAPLTPRSLELSNSFRQTPAEVVRRVAAALGGNRCNRQLRRLKLRVETDAVAREILDATDNLGSLRSLAVFGNGGMVLVDAVLPQLRYLSVVSCEATSGDLSAAASLRTLGLNCFERCGLLRVTCPPPPTAGGRRQLRATRSIFEWCKTLESIDLADVALLDTGSRFAAHCSNLTAVALPKTLVSLGDSNFYSCTALSTLDLSHTQLTSVGSLLLGQCLALATVLLPPSLGVVGKGAFSGCRELLRVDLSATRAAALPSGFAFNCTALVEVLLPATLADVDKGACGQCYSLQRIDISRCPAMAGAFSSDRREDGCRGHGRLLVGAPAVSDPLA